MSKCFDDGDLKLISKINSEPDSYFVLYTYVLKSLYFVFDCAILIFRLGPVHLQNKVIDPAE